MIEALLPHIPESMPHGWYYLCVGASVLITGVSKAGFGGGVGILAIPVMALAMGPTQMLGVMLPLLVACDVFSNLHHIGHYDSWSRFRPLLAGMAAGVVVGSAILWWMGAMPPASLDMILKLLVGSICLAVVILQAYRLTGREVPTLPPHPASSLAVGTLAGAVSTLNHAAGPIVQIYLMQREEDKLNKRKLVGTLLLYFLIGNALKLPTYCLLPMADGRPLINADTLHDSIWFLPLIPLGTVLGAWMHHRVPEKPFSAIMYVAAGASAAQMIYKVSPPAACAAGVVGLAVVAWAWAGYLRGPGPVPAAVNEPPLEEEITDGK